MTALPPSIVARALLLVTICSTVSAQFPAPRCCETYCYSQDSDRTQVKHFATKTAYEVIHGPSSSREHIVPSEFLTQLFVVFFFDC